MIRNGNLEPTRSEALEYVIAQALSRVNTGIPGSIITFNESKGTAEVQIEVNQLLEDGRSIKIAPLQNVLVERNRSNEGNSYLMLPVKAGDKGWIKFSQRTIDNWSIDGKQQHMTDLRMFDLSDAVFWPGVWPMSNPISEGNENVVLRNEKSRHLLKPEGHELNTESGAFYKIENDRLSMGNTSGEILSLFNDLLSQLLISYGVSPTGPAPLDPASVTEITRIQTVLSLIKES